MTTNSASKRDSMNNGGDTGANNPTASESHRATPSTPKGTGNIGGRSGSYASDWDGPVDQRTPRAPHLDNR